nr:hypothetical protein GCM10020092_100030 [Actinoplanes digitatis]
MSPASAPAAAAAAPFSRPATDTSSATNAPPWSSRPATKKLTATRHETLPSTRAVEEPITIGTTDGNDLGFSGGRTTYYENGEKDRLDEFVQDYRSELLQLEAILTDLGTGIRMPLNDLIIHAWRTAPKVIRNRADLMHSVANTYAEARTNMDEETKSLARYWNGNASEAFIQYAQSAGAWLSLVQAQAAWLAEEGKKAASLLEGLRNAYATTGYERIATLLEAMKTYIADANSLFSPCTNPEQALIKATTFFMDYMIDAEKNAVELAASLLKIDEQERKERPDLGTRGHDTVPFPAPRRRRQRLDGPNRMETQPQPPQRLARPGLCCRGPRTGCVAGTPPHFRSR